MIAALVTAGAVALAVIAFAWWCTAQIRDAERRTADARVGETSKAGQLAIAAADIATQKARADHEKERADALDDVLEEAASDGDAAGARSRVLRRLTRKTANAEPAGGGDAERVPDGGPDPSVARPTGDGLLKPGE